MSTTAAAKLEETLDPQDWSALRALGHQMVDDMLSYLENIRERPSWQPLPEEVKASFAEPLPLEPQGAESAYRDFKQNVLPFPLGNIHPRFWAWVCGSGTPGAMLADMLASAMNSNVHGGDHAAIYVEQQVLSWLKQALGYPAEASGLLVTGGSVANFVGLGVARNVKAGWDVKRAGLTNSRPLVVYCSAETHNSVQKAVEALGLGSDGLRYIETGRDFRIKMEALRGTVASDRKAGRVPICVVGNAGTVNSGAIDDLSALADFCGSENLWFHVDGAFGATAAISPALRPSLRGMERADSLAFDLHKWMYMPYDVGCVLVRSAERHRETFSVQAAYLDHQGRGLAGGPMWFKEYGLELSRSSRALKAWFSLKEHGLRKFQALVEQNVAQTRYLAEMVEADRRLELLAPAPLNIVCFRFRGGIDDENTLTALNKEILLQLQESGVASPSSTILGGRFAIRVANVNHRSRREDFEYLISEVIRLGEEIAPHM
ncbi:MAG TPA: pyridoxal-dependent decarboxylase [Terriglobales bacterium]|nr:pyridoxal-dependent decarboxylase [Terriglobales bacterium]